MQGASQDRTHLTVSEQKRETEYFTQKTDMAFLGDPTQPPAEDNTYLMEE